jgi:hypothetical protein
MVSNSMDRENMHKKLDAWLDELARVQPSVEDGETLVFKLTGYRVGYDDEDQALISFELETSRTETGL